MKWFFKLINSFSDCKGNRKLYRIKPEIKFHVDDSYYAFALIPTIVIQPWTYRYPKTYVIEIRWLIFTIGIGLWERKDDV